MGDGFGFIEMPLLARGAPSQPNPRILLELVALHQTKGRPRLRMVQADVSHYCFIVSTRNSSVLPRLAARTCQAKRTRACIFAERTSRRLFSPHFRQFVQAGAALLR